MNQYEKCILKLEIYKLENTIKAIEDSCSFNYKEKKKEIKRTEELINFLKKGL